MLIPCFKRLKKETLRAGVHASSYATFMHPNPLFYKYYWWVFWEGSPCDGEKLLSKQYRMPTKRAFELMEKLKSEQQSYWLYNTRLPRLDPVNSPLDPNSEKWREIEWAKSFDDDVDEEYRGFK